MGRKKKKRHVEGAPPESSTLSPEFSRDGGPEPKGATKMAAPPWPQPESAPPAAEPESKPAPSVVAGRASDEDSVPVSPMEESSTAGSASVNPPTDAQAVARPGFFARLAGWWRSLTGSAESVELHAEPGAPGSEAGAVETAVPEVPPSPRPEFTGPIDEDPVGTLESNLRLAVGLEQLREKLQHREKHVESLRDQRNELHQRMKEERVAAEGRIRTLEEELTGLRSHAEEPASQLQEALEASAARIQTLEAELTQTRDHATAAQAALAAQESRLRGLEEEIARMNPPIEDALDQLRLEKEGTLLRVQSLEGELGAAREQISAADGRAVALESELNQARERIGAAEGRAAALEAELDQGRAELEGVRAELETARAAASAPPEPAPQPQAPPEDFLAELEAERRRVQELGQKVEELARQLANAEREQEGARSQGQRELEQSQQESRRALAQVRDLEAALQQAQQLAQQREAELVGAKRQLESREAEQEQARPARKREKAEPAPAAGAEVAASVAADLYKQALTPLTVLNASADLLVMSLQDPSLKESAQDIKFQTQALMELMKKAAQPPEKK